MKRILVIGTSGSGKTTLGKKLSKKLAIPHFQLDALFFKDNWVEKSDEEFFNAIEQVTKSKDSWIIDGNFGRSNHLTWPFADTVVWLDMPFWLTIYQNFTRSIRRALTKEQLWDGLNNRESLRLLFSKESVTLWAIKTYKVNKTRYPLKMNDPQYAHINFHRLKSRREIHQFLKNLNLPS